jgi:uncharacterized protein YyaL (SSP411 family)
MANRLADQTSPYLLQHKDNPVDWYPWGDEAFERARTEDKPILLSVGYAACHWCHVMEHESFEDEATARIMNEHFVCIKVDREERPDVDSIYMDAVQTMTGHGGWPMTVFLTPEGAPFYGGTYFPPDDRHGMPSFSRLLQAVAETWRERRGEVEEQGKQLTGRLAIESRLRPSAEPITDDILREAFANLRSHFDPEHGGFGGAPKFPQPMTIDFLLRLARSGNEEAGTMARRTLDEMAAGGIFDQLGGGFHRYSVDRYWVVPHFEKMLYDNTQLLRTYTRAWQEWRVDRHREVAEATAAWMLDEMRDAQGGFWSTLDADSEGEEGKYYVWSLQEIAEVAGPDAGAAIKHFGVTEAGNFEGHNILVYAGPPGDQAAVTRARQAMLERRATRVRPGTDTKVLAGWNGMAVAALAEAGAVLDKSDWVTAAHEAMEFVLSRLVQEGRLMRSYRRTDDGREVINHLGFSEDYAFVLEGLLALYEATFEVDWLTKARRIADETIRLFLDQETGGFFTSGADAEQLVARPKDLQDNAIPSANSVLAVELQRLAHFTGDSSYESHAVGAMRIMREWMVQSPLGFGHLLGAVDFYTDPTAEIVIVGSPDFDDTRALLRSVRDRFRPNKVLICSPDDRAAPNVPLLEGRKQLNGRATAYVCRNGTCDLPVDDVEGLQAQLARL